MSKVNPGVPLFHVKVIVVQTGNVIAQWILAGDFDELSAADEFNPKYNFRNDDENFIIVATELIFHDGIATF